MECRANDALPSIDPHQAVDGASDELTGTDPWSRFLHLAKTGDEVAWKRLVEEAPKWIHARVNAIVHNDHDVWEVVQETMLRLLQHPFDAEKGRARTWIGIVARNVAIDWARRARVRRTVSLEGREGIDVGDEGPDAERMADAKEEAELVHQAVAGLPPKLREAVQMIYFDQRTYGEASAILKVPVGTVASRVHWALQKLRDRLRPRFRGPKPGNGEEGE